MASAQALTLHVGVSTPVANGSNGAKIFASNYAKLAGLTEAQRKAIRVVSIIHELNTANGALNYVSNHKQLIADANVFTHGISNIDPNVVLAVNDWGGAFLVDSTLTNDVAAILLEGKDFLALSETQINGIMAFLRFALEE